MPRDLDAETTEAQERLAELSRHREKAAEDYNNKSFNQDDQDQGVPMIVIFSPRSGMRAGPVRSGAYSTHYGLLRTIEEALGLPTMLTLNSRFATPLNGSWPARARGRGAA